MSTSFCLLLGKSPLFRHLSQRPSYLSSAHRDESPLSLMKIGELPLQATRQDPQPCIDDFDSICLKIPIEIIIQPLPKVLRVLWRTLLYECNVQAQKVG